MITKKPSEKIVTKTSLNSFVVFFEKIKTLKIITKGRAVKIRNFLSNDI